MGEVVPARTLPTLHPPSPPTVLHSYDVNLGTWNAWPITSTYELPCSVHLHCTLYIDILSEQIRTPICEYNNNTILRTQHLITSILPEKQNTNFPQINSPMEQCPYKSPYKRYSLFTNVSNNQKTELRITSITWEFTEAVFLYCCSDCPSWSVHLNNIDWAAWVRHRIWESRNLVE